MESAWAERWCEGRERRNRDKRSLCEGDGQGREGGWDGISRLGMVRNSVWRGAVEVCGERTGDRGRSGEERSGGDGEKVVGGRSSGCSSCVVVW